jgi:hypothetical protein
VRGAGAPHKPPAARVAGVQAKEVSLIGREVDASSRDGRLEGDEFTEVHLPQNLAGLYGEPIDFTRASPDKCLAIMES